MAGQRGEPESSAGAAPAFTYAGTPICPRSLAYRGARGVGGGRSAERERENSKIFDSRGEREGAKRDKLNTREGQGVCRGGRKVREERRRSRHRADGERTAG